MQKRDIFQLAKSLGYTGPPPGALYDLRDWLRDNHQIHVEAGSIWDQHHNVVEAKYYTIAAP